MQKLGLYHPKIYRVRETKTVTDKREKCNKVSRIMPLNSLNSATFNKDKVNLLS